VAFAPGVVGAVPVIEQMPVPLALAMLRGPPWASAGVAVSARAVSPAVMMPVTARLRRMMISSEKARTSPG
jgi:hypothetical protein